MSSLALSAVSYLLSLITSGIEEVGLLHVDKINITDCIVVIGLVIALIMTIFYGLNELSMSIASGLLGYIGGNVKSTMQTKGEDKR